MCTLLSTVQGRYRGRGERRRIFLLPLKRRAPLPSWRDPDSATWHHSLSIINVYNEIGTNTLQDLRQTLTSLAVGQEAIILGDFNLHYPPWSTTYRHTNHRIVACQPLLAIIEDFQL